MANQRVSSQSLISRLSRFFKVGEHVQILGKSEVQIQYKDQSARLPLIVVKGEGPNLFGRNWMDTINLNVDLVRVNVLNTKTSVEEVIKRHSEVFKEELGTFKGTTAKIYVEPGSKPIFHKPRPVSYFLKEKVANELQRLQTQGIISQVQFSDWAAPIVPVVKSDGSIRICGDYKVTVNRVAKQDIYPLPRVEDLFADLAGGKIFSKLDLKHAYQQVVLNEDSRKYTTVNTQQGLFQFNRLPFGISSTPAIFQRVMETLLRSVPRGVTVYLDDILVSGVDELDHLQNLDKVLQILESAGLTLKQSKCAFALPSVHYLGHIIDEKGLHPSPEKVRAIKEAPPPRDISELKSFLGLLTYYNRFLPNMSTHLSPLYKLLQKHTNWLWSSKEETAFIKAKELLQSSSLLVHFDPAKDLIVSADASPVGIGGVLSHKLEDGSQKPIAFTSRTLSAAERKYSQLEKEGLAVVFAVTKFHQYLHGRHFVIHSDHKPLQYLFKESRQVPVPR